MGEVLFLAEELVGLMNPSVPEDQSIIREGLSLYRQGMVTLNSDEKDFISAVVQDVTPKKVKLDMLFWGASYCSCENEGICKHKIAVFFTRYSSTASPTDWVLEWNNTRDKDTRNALKAHVIPANTLLKGDGPLEQSYSAWKNSTNELFTELVENNIGLPNYIIEGNIQTYLKRLASKSPIERNWKLLYQFTTYFFTLLLTLKLLDTHKKTPHKVRSFYTLADDIINELHNMMFRIGHRSRPFAFDDYVVELAEESRSLLEGTEGLEYEKIDLYRELWGDLFSTSTLRKAELDRLNTALSTAELDKTERNAYVIAAIHLYVIDQQDDKVLPMLKSLSAQDCPYLFYWLKQFSEQDSYERSLPFIEFLVRNLNEYLNGVDDYYESVDFVRTFTKPVSVSCMKLKKIDLLEKYYRESLPYSYWNYSSFLFDQGNYKKWVDMLIYSGVTIDTIGQDMIKTVVATHPELVLPLYHHAVQQTVSMKNRSAYKQAVRYLKKLRPIYKKMKQEEKFNEYLSYISHSTKRLRAFQEELQRSKLIDG